MLSIVMPCYNHGKFIDKAVESILNQTYKALELVIVNDGSTDDTEKILQPYLNDPRVTYVYKRNGGTGSALNKGFELTCGEFETWFASDNVAYPTAYETMMKHLTTHPDTDLVYANIEIGVMDKDGLSELYRKNIKQEVDQAWDADKFYSRYNLGIIWVWRRPLRIAAGEWFQTEPCEDYDMVTRMVEAGGKFVFHDECLGWFRRHSKNLSSTIPKSVPRNTIAKAKARRAALCQP